MTKQNSAAGSGPSPSGEFGLIAEITRRLTQGPEVLLGPGDDAAVVAAPDGRVVATTDVLVDGVHFRRDWSSARDVGVRAAAANLADIAAMGARPTALLVGLVLPDHVDRDWVLTLADGVADEVARAGASLVGGDIVRGEQLVVSATALGDLEGRPPALRSGAQPGDIVAVAGRLGWAAAGLAVLSRGFRSPKVLVEAHRRPEPDYAAALAAAPVAHALCDVSDGLIADLGHIARASGVHMELEGKAVSAHVTQPMHDVAGALGGADPLHWVLGGGDDHAFAGTFAQGGPLPTGWTRIGTVSDGGVGADGSGADAGIPVTLDGQVPPVSGHEHQVP